MIVVVVSRRSLQHSLGIKERSTTKQQNHRIIRVQQIPWRQAWQTGTTKARQIRGGLDRAGQ